MLPCDLRGRTAFVTGAGGAFEGRGMGRAISLALAEAGARIVAADLVGAAADATADAVRAAGGTAVAAIGDISIAADVDRMVGEAEAAFGPVHILVNHAGTGNFELAGETPDDRWRTTMGVCLDGPFFTTRRVLPGMLDAGGGTIVNTISACGLVGGRAGAAYTAAKHGLVGLTKNVAATYGRRGIRCNGVCPGGVRAEASAAGGAPGERLATPMPQPAHVDESFDLIGATLPRTGTPDEVAAVVVFLASDLSSFVNGAVVPVDAGWVAI